MLVPSWSVYPNTLFAPLVTANFMSPNPHTMLPRRVCAIFLPGTLCYFLLVYVSSIFRPFGGLTGRDSCIE